MNVRIQFLSVALGAVVLTGAAALPASAQTSSDTVKVCVVPGTGTIYRLPPGTGACLNSAHTIVTWSAIGPRGLTGAAGPTGPTGPAGPAGTSGLPCNQCVNSASIADGAVTDAKFGVISTPGKVANTATSASPVASAGTIVLRDGGGGIAASTVAGTTFSGTTAAFTGPLTASTVGATTVTGSASVIAGSLQLLDGSATLINSTGTLRMQNGITIYSSADLSHGVRLSPGTDFWSPIAAISDADGTASTLDFASAVKRIEALQAANAALERRLESQERRLAAIEAALGLSTVPAPATPREREPR
jgi:hypothetical protein